MTWIQVLLEDTIISSLHNMKLLNASHFNIVNTAIIKIKFTKHNHYIFHIANTNLTDRQGRK